jgi:metal-responsive CopG/Arc/MetJ family transcriptional regulator
MRPQKEYERARPHKDFSKGTIIVTISIPGELIKDIEEFMYVFDIPSRSRTITILLQQGLLRVKEQFYDRYSAMLPDIYPPIKEKKQETIEKISEGEE